MKTVVTYHLDGTVSIAHDSRTMYFQTVSGMLAYMERNDLAEDEVITE